MSIETRSPSEPPNRESAHNCPVCAGPNTQLETMGSEIDVYTCLNCGSEFTVNHVRGKIGSQSITGS